MSQNSLGKFILIFTLPLSLLYGTPPAKVCTKKMKPIQVTARHIEANGIGYNMGYTTLEAFLVGNSGNYLPFIDLRAHLFNDSNPAANIGIGLRYIKSRVWGINTYYDYRKTNHSHYNQFSLGLESLGETFDFRMNGYLPFGSKRKSIGNFQFDRFENHFMFISRKHEFTLKGADAECGLHINKRKKVPIYLTAGPYYLNGEGKSTWGAKVRAQVNLSRYITVEGISSYDSLFKWIAQGQIGLNIPLGKKQTVKQKKTNSCSKQFSLIQRAYQQINRNEIIPTSKKQTEMIAINKVTGEPFFFWFVDNTSHSLGTIESPFNNLAAAQSASSPNDIIYVFRGDGTDTGMNTGLTLKQGQQLLGAGTGQNLNSIQGIIYVPPQATGLPVISNAASAIGDFPTAVLLNTGNNVVSGIYLAGTSGGSIDSPLSISGGSNYLIQYNVLTTFNQGNCLNVTSTDSTVGNIQFISNTILGTDLSDTYGLSIGDVTGAPLVMNGTILIRDNVFKGIDNSSSLRQGVHLVTGGALPGFSASILDNRFVSRVDAAADNPSDIYIYHTGNENVSPTVSGNYINVKGPPFFDDSTAGIYIRRITGGTGVLTANVTNNVSITIPPTPGYLYQNDTGNPTLLIINSANNIGTVSGP